MAKQGEQSPFNFLRMSHIVMEILGAEYVIIVTDTDGNNLVFETRQEAGQEAENFQDGIVVEL
jgi:hypothetical protein